MRHAPRLAERLQTAPHRFDGLQAIRLAELGPPQTAGDGPPGPIHITAQTGLAFAPAPVPAVRSGPGRTRIRAAFLGLTGPLGVLPQVYSEMIHTAGRLRNAAFPAFFDLFTHRLATLFLHASEKYRLPLLVQRSLVDWPARRSPEPVADLPPRLTEPAGPASEVARRIGRDPVSRAMLAVAGLGTPHLRGRMAIADEVVLYYAGLFAARTRPAQSLQAMLSDYLGLDVVVEQFAGRWLPVAAAEQTCLPRAGEPPRFCALGIDTVAGSRVWDVQSAFRIVVGPVDTAAMLDLMPDQPLLDRLVDLVRVYAGTDLLFDVQVILHRDSIPELQMNAAAGQAAPRLGWNTWARSLPALDHSRDIILDPDLVSRSRTAAPSRKRDNERQRATQQQTSRSVGAVAGAEPDPERIVLPGRPSNVGGRQ